VTALASPITERRTHRSWRIWRIGPLNERAYRLRLIFVPTMLAVQLFLYCRLWTAVYQHTTSAGGLDVKQAITYSLMALLAARIRWSARSWSMDSVQTRVREGTIIYWFVRPIPPARYYMWRQGGDMAYGAMWAVAGFLVLLGTGVIAGPGNLSRWLVFVVSLILGQVVLYYLGQLVDLSTFWILSNNGVGRMYYFIQDLLSGVFVPLWFMPGWLITASIWLPFNAGINVPLSLYVGRTAHSQASEQLALQAFWILLLASAARWLWTRAAQRVTAMGG
jgi:ABC-2 type transport system permease protein